MKISVVSAIALATLVCVSSAMAKGPQSGPGQVLIGVDASEWNSDTAGPGLKPIGGAGQINGEFTTASRNGIEIGLRAQERYLGPNYPAIPNSNNRVGIYEVPTGTSDGLGRAVWNYDWHIDLRNAFGVASGKTLGDYDVELNTDFAKTIFTKPVPLDLTFDGALAPSDTVLYQGSFNAEFGDEDNEFDADAPGTYTFTLTLTPKTFKGAPLQVTIVINVS